MTMSKTNRKYQIAVVSGDGIGKEVMPEGLRALEAAGRKFGFDLELSDLPFACCDYYLKHKVMMPEDWKDQIGTADAILFGAVGWPELVPDHISLWGSLIQFRREFDQYVSLRPVKLLDGVPSPLAGRAPGDIDFVVVRENTEGEYSSIGGRMFPGTDREFVVQETVMTRIGVDRILRYAFELASQRKGHLTSATKSNGISISMPYWDERVAEMAKSYPAVSVDKYHIDILTAMFVLHPDRFDVVVASNLFGDIHGRVHVRFRHQHHEFLAARSRHQRAIADAAGHATGDEPDDLIAGLMAPGVVETLEVVDITNRDGQGRAGLVGFSRQLVQNIVHAFAVGDAGQGVGHGFFAHDFQICPKLRNFLLGLGQTAFQRRTVALHGMGRVHEGGNHGFQRLGIGFGIDPVAGAGQGLAIGRGVAAGFFQPPHDGRQLGGHGAADFLNLVAELLFVEMAVVKLHQIRFLRGLALVDYRRDVAGQRVVFAQYMGYADFIILRRKGNPPFGQQINGFTGESFALRPNESTTHLSAPQGFLPMRKPTGQSETSCKQTRKNLGSADVLADRLLKKRRNMVAETFAL